MAMKSNANNHDQDSLLEQAYTVLEDILSKPNGSDLFFAANILYMLQQEEVPLDRNEQILMTQRILDVADCSVVPLLTAERVDAVCTLLHNGMRETRSPEFPEATAEQMKELLFNCELDVFAEIVESVAVDNQSFYAPDNEYSEDAVHLRQKATEAIDRVANRNTALTKLIRSAKTKAANDNIPPDVSKDINFEL